VVGALGVSSGWSKNFDLDYPEFFDTKFISSDPKALIPATAQTSSPGKLITKFTAVIQVITPHLDQLKIVLKTLENTHTCGQVLLILNLKLKDESIINNLIRYYKKVELIKMSKLDRLDDISERFGGIVLERARYNCILSLDDDVILINDELDYGFSVWRSTPERIVGFPGRLHYWLEGNMPDADGNLQKITRWAYTSKFHNDYSMILTGAAFIHKHYLEVYKNYNNMGGHIGRIQKNF